MEDNGFLYLALICTSVVLEPCWFFGDLTHTSCFVSPSSHVLWGDALGEMLGTVWFQRRELLCACFGMVTLWGGWITECFSQVLSEGVFWSDNSFTFFLFFYISVFKGAQIWDFSQEG